ncbi:HU domain-containing protein [Emticicia fluvialis]|uniref:HU domain-containing protein n=1 Tax=Emticicia fluvialis TaxID=2974474 RepID=UPI0021665C7F|nr:SPOR domain-containing protein [Emticicia fluvialis]
MKPVAEYIRTLLFEHDYVAVPNFGAFIANYMPSSLNDISGSLMPPQKKIAFNEILKHDDGLLATYISRRESVTIDEAKRTIQNFVSEIKGSLASQRAFHFERIGNFSLNEENNLVFDPDRRHNFFSESFGFDSIFPRTVDKPSYTMSQTFDVDDELVMEKESYTSTDGTFKWKYVLYTVPVLLVSTGLFFVLLSRTEKTEAPARSSFNPLDYLPKKTVVVKQPDAIAEKDSIAQQVIKPEADSTWGATETKAIEAPLKNVPIETKPVEKPIEVSKTVVETPAINSIEKRYLIVSGIFKNKENVKRLSASLLKNGFSPRVIETNGLMKVVAAEADSMEEANAIADKHQKLIGEKPAITKSK